MTDNLKKQRAVEVQKSIGTILFQDWDPIGVNDLAPDDEYDSYIGGIYRLLVDNKSIPDIAEYLRQLEITVFQMVTSPERRTHVAAMLKELDLSL